MTATSFLSPPSNALHLSASASLGHPQQAGQAKPTEDSSHEQGSKSASFKLEAEALGFLLGLVGSGEMS